MNIEQKRQHEKRIVKKMIEVYCHGHHHMKNGVCDECQSLIHYCDERINLCPMMETKTFCSACKVHCYRSEERQQIRQVMRYSGPRMLFYHPILLIKHCYIQIKTRPSTR